jgi:hypothetical protein
LCVPEERPNYERTIARGIAEALLEAGKQDEGEEGIERLMEGVRAGQFDLVSREVATIEEGIPVISAEDVAAYYKRLPSVWLHDLVGPLAPPFPEFFIEVQGVPMEPAIGVGVRAFGAFVRDFETANGRGAVDEWCERQSCDPDTVGWVLHSELILEWEKTEPVGPVLFTFIPVARDGSWLFRGDEPLWWSALPTFGLGGLPGDVPEEPPEYVGDEMEKRLALYLAPLLLTISFMHCRNVSIRPVDPPERLSRRYERKHNRPLTRYHVLDIEPMRRILDTEGEAQTKGLRHALHICRGHFKTFTEDAPLFGRHVGTYWWPAYVRGSAEVGTVEKDYRLRLDSGEFGQAYTEADENVTVAPAEEKPDDPDSSQRGLRAHNRTQNLLATAVEAAGFAPRRKGREEPNFDLAWKDGETVWVAEVKSTTEQNEEQQMRLAIGQVIRYRQLLSEAGREARAMIAIENAPFDESWIDLCGREGIALVWPEVMAQAI